MIVSATVGFLLKEETRKLLTDAAVRIGREVGYRSAGTCEFLLDRDDNFYFLEVRRTCNRSHCG